MASVEATQSMEVLFALLGEIIFLSIAIPSALSWLGIAVVIAGMTLHSFAAHKTTALIADKKKLVEK